jgi:dimethylaniline monooxygenase (N-oxide forming)
MNVRVPAARFSHARTLGLRGGQAKAMSAGAGEADVAVIGAGSSGLAVVKALREQGVDVEGFERGSDVGGLWRYENDNGLSGAYRSLRTNVSCSRMQYPSFPMPESYGDFPRHSERAAYLRAYAEASGRRSRSDSAPP